MVKFPGLPDAAHLSDLFQAYPANVGTLMAFTDDLMRGDGALSVAERELIAAYVSALNACNFCFGSHKIYAEAFGIEEGVIEAAIEDPKSAPVSPVMKALLTYLAKVNHLPSKLVQADLDAVFDAGASEGEVVEALQVAGLFNMMNRIIEGAGVTFDYAKNDAAHPARKLGAKIASHTYSGTPMGQRS